jgi:hypothetical protein
MYVIAWAWSKDMWYEHSAWIRSIDARHGHARRSCSIDMQYTVDIDMSYGHAIWTWLLVLAQKQKNMFCK